ncbi:DUF4139 domain-containing protein [Sphingomonas glaciei]|uniref:DUF4139 domain-containing protein n=1 Tax=Sphingomonas glaciei TaxID=2938948 RepID=A0ABY5MRR8_9SPHN|nr:hypothetical protein [Sphingomonas glaciei]UUR07180.1 hypothetical protein M1K48_09510 [Sphingomonas glaciei]
MRLTALLILAVVAAPAGAQQVVTSAGPERVGVTVYRDPDRGRRRPALNWLNGYALISETRSIDIPAGESELRFEGVASGIIPQSAIVGGVPEGLLERNRDALLLSAGSLVGRALGNRVTLRRTDRATGTVVEGEAIVRSGGDGGVVLQTAAGVEALRCTGLAETLVYDRVPAGLSARPTLSVRVRARQALRASVTLSYLATGFDWQADYVATLSRDERKLQLRAWLTLASTDDTSFPGATTQAVAGQVNREGVEVAPVESPPLRLQCWPAATTSTVSQPDGSSYANGDTPPAPPAPPPPPPPVVAFRSEEIVVTGSRITAVRERLGDLQLYRIPEPVTVGANAQKQVGLLDRPAVKVEAVYRMAVVSADEEAEEQGELLLRSRNREEQGLGLPLPSGNLVLFREGAGRPLLIGEGHMRDTAVGEKVEIKVAETSGVRVRLSSGEGDRRTLVVTNDRPVAVQAEVELLHDDGDRIDGAKLMRRDGKLLWLATVPANGSATISYRIRRS